MMAKDKIVTELKTLVDQIGFEIEKLRLPQPSFSLELGWAEDYESLFGGEYAEKTDALTLLRRIRHGRLLISARGGGAKTVLLRRIAKTSIQLGMIPILVSLKGWTGRNYQSWRDSPSSAARLDYLFSTSAIVPMTALSIEELDPGRRRLILVDGLNEVNSRTGQELIYMLDEYVRFAANTCVIVTDRLVRRVFDSQRWQLAELLPLPEAEITNQIMTNPDLLAAYKQLPAESQDLLSSPYFLDIFLRDRKVETTKSDEFRSYFLTHVLSEDELDITAKAAFEAYKTLSRTFDVNDFRKHSGAQIVEKLKNSGALVIEGDLAYFDHHLKHDYLVSRFLSTHTELWNPDAFKIVSFGASSFETITLALEQVQSADYSDLFLRRVYDWNVYAAGTALADARASLVSTEMQVVILAMFAERRWDLLSATAQKASDTLRLIKSQRAQSFRSADSLEQIFALLLAVNSKADWFRNWRELYIRPKGSNAEEGDLQRLADEDSVVGWTSSNVLKRLKLSSDQQANVRKLLAAPKTVIRWRAAHVLGAFPSEENLDGLLSALGDEDVWVRYGAIRSLVELALRSHELSGRIFNEIFNRVDLISSNRIIVEEFQRAVLVPEDIRPPKWRDLVLPVAATLQARAETQERMEEWNRVLKALLTK